MKLLLTSFGLTNASIKNALVDMIGKPVEQSKAVFVPTAMHAVPGGGGYLWDELKKQSEIGWHSLSILELTAIPSILEEHWLPALQEADVIMVCGGNTPYLSFWFEKSGFAEKLPELLKRCVYVGVSAGSMVMTHSFNINQEKLKKTGVYADDQYGDTAPPQAGSDYTLKLVDFALRPHLNADYFDHVSLRDMEKAAAKVDVQVYVIDDQTAVKVVDGRVEVVSEGEWKLFNKR